MVVAQWLIEQSFLTAEICSSNSVIGNFIYHHLYRKDEQLRRKMPGIALFKKYLYIPEIQTGGWMQRTLPLRT